MLPVGSYQSSDRAREKQESREREELRADSDEAFPNGFFSKLDRSKVRIVRRKIAA
jgi:hypothetical protein